MVVLGVECSMSAHSHTLTHCTHIAHRAHTLAHTFIVLNAGDNDDMKLDMDALIGTGVRYTVAGRDNKLKVRMRKKERHNLLLEEVHGGGAGQQTEGEKESVYQSW